MADNLSLSARVDVLTLEKVLKKVTEPIMRQRPFLSYLKKKGRMVMNSSGKTLDWRVRYRRNEGQDFDDMEGSTATRENRHKAASLGWGAFHMTEGITEIEKAINKGPEAILRVVSNLVDWMKGDLVIGLEERLMQGSEAHSLTKIIGVENWMDEGSALSDTLVYDANGTYAGMTTDLGDYGGAYAGFPYATCDPEATFWTPVLVDYESTSCEADTKEWRYTWEEACRYGIGGLETMQGTTPDVIMVTPPMFRQIKESLSNAAHLNIERGKGGSMAAELGFTTVNLDGVPIIAAYGLPANTGYGLCFDHMELHSLRPVLFSEKKQEDITVYTEIFDLCFLGQLRIDSPAYSMKLYPYT